MKPHRRGPTRRSAKQRRASMILLVHGCTPERLAQMTAESLAGAGAKPAALAEAEKMLADAREARG